jgi:hypothetical protein
MPPNTGSIVGGVSDINANAPLQLITIVINANEIIIRAFMVKPPLA